MSLHGMEGYYDWNEDGSITFVVTNSPPGYGLGQAELAGRVETTRAILSKRREQAEGEIQAATDMARASVEEDIRSIEKNLRALECVEVG